MLGGSSQTLKSSTFPLKLSLDCTKKGKSLCLAFFFVGPVHCSRNPQVQISVNVKLKLGSTPLFTYLKIILLQYFQQ